MSEIDTRVARWGYASVTDKISDIVLHRPVHWIWALGFIAGHVGTLRALLVVPLLLLPTLLLVPVLRPQHPGGTAPSVDKN